MEDRRIYVTETDMALLETMLLHTRSDTVSELEAELARATVVKSTEIPPDAVTMNSRVVFEDTETRVTKTVTLVYPADADAAAGRISVLAPVGSALLGLSVGQVIEWPVPSGKRRKLRIIEVLYQPEAAGQMDL